MAIGKRKGQGLPAYKYDARAGVCYTQDRVYRNGAWQAEQHDVTENPALFDVANLQVGWLRFPKGAAPEAVLFPAGADIGEPPTPEHKQGVRLLVEIPGDKTGVRELLSSAAVFWDAVDLLHDEFVAAAADHPRQVPLVQIADTAAVRNQAGVSYAPVFKIVGWQPRPADMPETAAPRPQPKPKPKAAVKRGDMDDEIPF